MDKPIRQRAGMHYATAAERIGIDYKTRGMAPTRGGFIILIGEEILVLVVERMNSTIRLMGNRTLVIWKKEMLQYLAILLTSHTTSLTMVKAINILRGYRAVMPPVERVQWIAKHVLAFPISGRHGQGEGSLMCQRDKTRSLTEFEWCEFRRIRAIFLNVLHLFLTLEDDRF